MEDYQVLILENLNNIFLYVQSIEKFLSYFFALVIFLITIRFIYLVFGKIFFGGL